jgi:hypothetical protein
MEALEATMKKHNINIDSSSSHGHAIFASGFFFNATSTSSSNEWFIDSGASYHMDNDKSIFSSFNECNTKQIFFGDDISLRVVGYGTIQVNNGKLCAPILSRNLLLVYPITHSGEGKIKEFFRSTSCNQRFKRS